MQCVAGGSDAQFSPQRTAWQMIYKYDRGKQLKRKQKHCKCCKWPGCFWSAAIILVLWCTVCNTQLSHATLFPLTVSMSTAVRSWPIKSQWVHYYWLLQMQEQQIVLRMQLGTPHKILYIVQLWRRVDYKLYSRPALEIQTKAIQRFVM